MAITKMTQEKLNFLIENKDLPNKKLSEILEVGKRTITTYRKTLNLRRDNEYRRKHKEFNKIDDFSLGWCLGLFASDGCLSKTKNNRIFFTLAKKDIDVLFSLVTTITTNASLDDISEKPKNKVGYCGTLPKFVEVIKKYLIFENKTYDLCINMINFNLQSLNFKLGFLRGYIDGDGYVSKRGYVSVVSASTQIIKDLQNLYGGTIKKRKSGNYWDLHFSVEDMKKLTKLGLFSNIVLPMKRKTERLRRYYE